MLELKLLNNKNIFFIWLLCCLSGIACGSETDHILIFDNINNFNNNHTVKKYRNGANLMPSLNASGSAQPNPSDLKHIIHHTNSYFSGDYAGTSSGKIFIIDLRKEPHAMLNEYAVSWYGFKNQVPNHLEQKLIGQLLKQKTIRVYKNIDKLPDGYFIPRGFSIIKPKHIVTEQAMVEKLGANYLRILVTDHHAPEADQVDLFINFIKNLPTHAWLHFHCRGGKGRTTAFMTMYDIIQNGKILTLDDILKRQYQLGGIKLSSINFTLNRKKWKEPAAKERYDFMQNFYEYVLDPNGYNKLSWSAWMNTKSN